MKLYYVTGNPAKFEEVKAFFKEHLPAIELHRHTQDFVEPQTLDQESIAREKAAQAYAQVAAPVLVDDAGIYFDRYHEFPGTMTKFVFDAIGFDGIFKLVPHQDNVHMQCIMAYQDNQHEAQIVKAIVPGALLHEPDMSLFNANKPFDVVFAPAGEAVCYAQLEQLGKKADYNYRVRALYQLKSLLISKSQL